MDTVLWPVFCVLQKYLLYVLCHEKDGEAPNKGDKEASATGFSAKNHFYHVKPRVGR
jgi:hypothetical protein